MDRFLRTPAELVLELRVSPMTLNRRLLVDEAPGTAVELRELAPLGAPRSAIAAVLRSALRAGIVAGASRSRA